MSKVLNSRERKGLDKLSFDESRFLIGGELVGIGKVTLASLVDLGLAETGTGRFGEPGWRITDDGWRCMYGMTLDEIRSLPAGSKSYPFRVWRWPLVPGIREVRRKY